MAPPDRERMSSVDTAWLRMDRPYNLMMINAVMIFENKLTLDKLRQVLATRFLIYKRFRQRVVHNPGGAYFWETDAHFEINSHVRRIGLPEKGGKKELEELVGDLMSAPLDHSKPLWQVHLVEDYQGGSAVIWRIHHCIADGIALVHVVLSMTDVEPDPKENPRAFKPSPPPVIHKNAPEPGHGVFKNLFEPIGGAVNSAVKASRDLIEEGVDLVTHPTETMGYARHGVGLASEAVHLLTMPDEPDTRFRGKPGVAKRVAWAEPLPLVEVKEIGKVLGCSINDVLLASVAGALHSYLVEKGDKVDGLEIRATVPVNLRPIEQARHLGNRFGLVYLTLPIGIADPLERLFEVQKRMEKLKGSYQAILALGLLGTLGLAPNIFQASALKVLTRKATAVMTNVPGTQYPLYLGGAKIAEQMFWVPQTGSIGMGVSILSYNNRVHFGMATNAKIISDPHLIIDRFPMEFEKLLLTTLMKPWGETPDSHPAANPPTTSIA